MVYALNHSPRPFLSGRSSQQFGPPLRLVAVSATIPNINGICIIGGKNIT